MTKTTIRYTMSEAQFMQAAGALWSYEAIGVKGNLILAILAVGAGPVLLIYGQPLGWLCLAIAAFFVILTWGRSYIWRRAYRKMEKYTAPITASFSAERVSVDSAQGASDLPWDYFKSYAETPDYVFLFAPKRGLSIIPKTAFETVDILDQTRSHIAANLPRKKMRWT